MIYTVWSRMLNHKSKIMQKCRKISPWCCNGGYWICIIYSQSYGSLLVESPSSGVSISKVLCGIGGGKEVFMCSLFALPHLPSAPDKQQTKSWSSRGSMHHWPCACACYWSSPTQRAWDSHSAKQKFLHNEMRIAVLWKQGSQAPVWGVDWGQIQLITCFCPVGAWSYQWPSSSLSHTLENWFLSSCMSYC